MSTTIPYEVQTSSAVEIAIYDVSGRMLRTLVRSVVPAGQHRVQWDGRDGNGRLASSGVYFYSMRAGSFQSQKRVVVLK